MGNKFYEKKLYYNCRDAISKTWEIVAPPPPKIMFELTNECNHHCIFCANKLMKRKIGYMKKEVFTKIAIEAFELGVYELALYTTGESLLHPEIVNFTRAAKDIGYRYVYLSSNGALLNPALSKSLIEAGLDSLRISLDAGSRETYKKIHGYDDFNRVIENVKKYNLIRKEIGSSTLLSVNFVMTNITSSENERLEKLLDPHVDAIKWTGIRIQGGKMSKVVQKLCEKKDDSRHGLKPCGLLWNGMHVDYAGNLTLCCVDFDGSMVVGNILERGLMNCWNGPEMKEHRRLHLSNNLDPESLCYKCLKG